jgi:nucleoside 2-deoxyribosyltransferase
MSQPHPIDQLRVYCAGPLFNQAERTEMTAIADILIEARFLVYLPHRDGMEFRLVHEVLIERGWDPPTAAGFLHASIFALDVYQLAVACDCMVWNLNGRVPDEGAVSEAAIAWTLGKPLIAYQDDVRSLIAGRVNPLLVGLVDFETVEELADIPETLARAITIADSLPPTNSRIPMKLQKAVDDGQRLWEALQQTNAHEDNERIADVVTELFAPQKTTSGERPA